MLYRASERGSFLSKSLAGLKPQEFFVGGFYLIKLGAFKMQSHPFIRLCGAFSCRGSGLAEMVAHQTFIQVGWSMTYISSQGKM